MVKIKKTQRLEFRSFILDNLDRNFLMSYPMLKLPVGYDEQDLILLGNSQEQKGYGIILQNSNWTQKNTLETIGKLRRSNITPIQIFYKDGENFHVRLGSSGNFRADKAFKNYSKADIDKMVHLRQNEKIDLERLGSSILTYYQPQTQRLEESLRFYLPKNVILDHSHIENSFANGGFSVDYKILNEGMVSVKSNLTPAFNGRGKYFLHDGNLI